MTVGTTAGMELELDVGELEREENRSELGEKIVEEEKVVRLCAMLKLFSKSPAVIVESDNNLLNMLPTVVYVISFIQNH